MQETDNGYELFYSENSLFSKTDITFNQGTPDLTHFYLDGTHSDKCRLFVTDETIAELPFMNSFITKLRTSPQKTDALIVLPAGEAAKNIDSVLSIVKAALDKDFTRNAVFIGIGGGVICDMTGFAASMFKRGVQCEFIPTTLLADVDAAIGGKTGCDFSSYKNMIGAFWPARSVRIWSGCIQTLSDREYRSGLAEALKTALLFSEELVHLFEDKREQVLSRDDSVLLTIIKECAKAKAKIVHEDLREQGNRAFLNYGHTFGHALESVAGLGTVTHGEGVAWGMGRACDIGVRLGICSKDFAERTKNLLASYGYDMAPVPQALKEITNASERLLTAMKKDKKNMTASCIRLILQAAPLRTIIKEADDKDILSVLCEEKNKD